MTAALNTVATLVIGAPIAALLIVIMAYAARKEKP